MNKREAIGILVLAAIFVLSPLFLFALRMPVSEFENRPLSGFPKMKVSSLKNPGFYEAVTKAIEDRNPLRWYAVVAKSRMQYALFGMISNPLLPKTVRVGRNGWLYIEKDISQPCWIEQQLQPGLDVVEQMEESLTDAGKLFFFTVAPNKSTAYADYLSVSSKELDCSGKSRALLGELVVRSGIVGYIDAFSIIESRRRNDERYLYSPLDTHWTSLGSAHFVTQLAKILGVPIDEATPLDRVGSDRRLPDLSRLAGLFYEETADIYRHRLAGKVEIARSDIPHEGAGRPYIHLTSKSRGRKLDGRKMLVLHDSFFYVSQDQISALFDDVLYVHWSAFDPKTFGSMARDADIVIVESVEREVFKRLCEWGPREAEGFVEGFTRGESHGVWQAPLESSSITRQ